MSERNFQRNLTNKDLSDVEWETAGYPEIWHEVASFENIFLDDDRAFGSLRLSKVVNGVIVDQAIGNHVVCLDNFIGVSEMYGFDKPVLFKKVEGDYEKT